MDARFQFEWSGEKAKDAVTTIISDVNLVPDRSYKDIVKRDDAEYEVTVSIRLKHKRKSRKKHSEQENPDG